MREEPKLVSFPRQWSVPAENWPLSLTATYQEGDIWNYVIEGRVVVFFRYCDYLMPHLLWSAWRAPFLLLTCLLFYDFPRKIRIIRFIRRFIAFRSSDVRLHGLQDFDFKEDGYFLFGGIGISSSDEPAPKCVVFFLFRTGWPDELCPSFYVNDLRISREVHAQSYPLCWGPSYPPERNGSEAYQSRRRCVLDWK